MSVFRSNKQISVQLIDDLSGKTLVATSSLVKEIAEKTVTKSEQAELVGQLLKKQTQPESLVLYSIEMVIYTMVELNL